MRRATSTKALFMVLLPSPAPLSMFPGCACSAIASPCTRTSPRRRRHGKWRVVATKSPRRHLFGNAGQTRIFPASPRGLGCPDQKTSRGRAMAANWSEGDAAEQGSDCGSGRPWMHPDVQQARAQSSPPTIGVHRQQRGHVRRREIAPHLLSCILSAECNRPRDQGHYVSCRVIVSGGNLNFVSAAPPHILGDAIKTTFFSPGHPSRKAAGRSPTCPRRRTCSSARGDISPSTPRPLRRPTTFR